MFYSFIENATNTKIQNKDYQQNNYTIENSEGLVSWRDTFNLNQSRVMGYYYLKYFATFTHRHEKRTVLK